MLAVEFGDAAVAEAFLGLRNTEAEVVVKPVGTGLQNFQNGFRVFVGEPLDVGGTRAELPGQKGAVLVSHEIVRFEGEEARPFFHEFRAGAVSDGDALLEGELDAVFIAFCMIVVQRRNGIEEGVA